MNRESNFKPLREARLGEEQAPGGGGGHIGIFRVGMCHPGHQIGTPL